MKLMNIRTLCLCLIGVQLACSCRAQQIQLRVNTLQCDNGRKYYPKHAYIAVFDADKEPEILQMATELLKKNEPTSDPNESDRALKMAEDLEKRIHQTRPLAFVANMTPAHHLFRLPFAKHVIIVAFGQSEFAAYMFAATDLEVSEGHLNRAVLNFSTEEECRNAK